MSETIPTPGGIDWTDLTVPDAEPVCAFYESVVGWTSEAFDMGGYSDHCMKDAAGKTVAGICHAKGANAGLPAQWLVYLNVADLDASLGAVTQLGGKVLREARPMGGGSRMAVIEDPAGAVCALFQHGSEAAEPVG